MSLAFLVTHVGGRGDARYWGALYTITAGLSRGSGASLVAAAGCTLGIVPHMIAAITGLAAVLNASAVAFQTLKYLGVAYLLFLAWQTWRDTTPLALEQAAGPRSSWRVVRTAVFVPRQEDGRLSGSGKLGAAGSARPV